MLNKLRGLLYKTLFNKPKRKIDRVFIHCSASDNPKHDDISVIEKWHLNRGFSSVGYHYFIQKDGRLIIGRDLEKTPAAQKGHNKHTVAICLHGLTGFTTEQFNTLKKLCFAINWHYEDITFHGHCEVSNKTCPVFDYRLVLGLNEKGYIQ